MNIFALSDSPILAAQWQHDRHVTKMTVESAQLLSWAVRLTPRFLDLLPKQHVDQLYRESHKNNPLTAWTMATDANFAWLAIHGAALCAEKHRRFPLNGMHKSYPLLTAFSTVAARLAGVERMWTRDADRNLIIDPAITALASQHEPFFQAMQQFPQYMVRGDSIQAYRNFYLGEKIFQDHVKWTNCESLPGFINNFIEHEAFNWPPMFAGKVAHRIIDLQNAHDAQIALKALPRDPHPDTLKPVNPKAITRFGVRK